MNLALLFTRLPYKSISLAGSLGVMFAALAADSETPLAPASTVAPAMESLEAQARQRGRAIVSQAFSLLSTNLATALRDGGATNAIPYCSMEATPLTRAVAETNKVVLRRATHKPRNPSNRATPEEVRLLRRFQEDVIAQRTPPAVVQTNASGTISFFAPIVINNPLCLNCHGERNTEVKPETLEVLARLYPKDEAVGFKLNDLRGLWRIDFRAEDLR